MNCLRLAFSLVLCWLALARAGSAQPLRGSTYEALMRVGDEQLAAHRPYNALELYKEAYDKEPSGEVALKLADLNYELRDYTSAVRYYERRLRRADEGEELVAQFRLARSQKMLGEYPEAIGTFEEFLRQAKLAGANTDSLRGFVTRANLEIVGAKVAIEVTDPPRIAVTNAGRTVNTTNQEYSPVLAPDGSLYYATFGKNGTVFEQGDENKDIRIYRAEGQEDGGYGKGVPLGSGINQGGVHTTNLALSPDGTEMLLVRNRLAGSDIEVSDLYYLRAGDDGSFANAEPVTGLKGKGFVKNPAFGELFGERVIFFSSNRPGGQGGYDLYYATRRGEGDYADAVNLGQAVNTPGNEETPFFRDGVLYFSSDGLATMGGFDVFRTEWSGQNWSPPTNMGKGFNSSLDDRYFQLDATGKHGVLTSNRAPTRSVKSKTCCDDIFLLDVEPIVVALLATTLDGEGQLLPNVSIDLVELSDGDSTIIARKRNPKGNRFDFELFDDKSYVIVARREGYLDSSVELNTVGVTEAASEERTLVLERKPEEVAPEDEMVEITINQPIRLANIYYDYDDDKILPEAEPDLNYIHELMVQYPELVIELGSHTDSRGEDSYNLDLSQRRAESARQYLLGREIAGDRVQARGYGETDILNACVNGERCSNEDHRFNRRTEFKILEGPTSIEVRKLRRTSTGEEVDPNAAPDTSGNKGGKGGPRAAGMTTGRVDTTPTAGRPVVEPELDELSSLSYEKEVRAVPLLQFDERRIEFGAVKKGDTREHVYRFTNVGEVPASIGIVSACECTTLNWTKGEIPPGGEGEIEAVFDSSDKDAGELIVIDIVLDQTAPSGNGIIEQVQFTFELTE